MRCNTSKSPRTNIGKASLLAACARAIGVPARVGYADVRNHLTSPRLYEKIKTLPESQRDEIIRRAGGPPASP